MSYKMQAHDSITGGPVTWITDQPDLAGTYYPGPGTASSIVVVAAADSLLNDLSVAPIKLWDKAAIDAAASTTTTEHPVYRFDGNETFTKFYVVPEATLTANDTTYASIILSLADGAGDASSAVATIATKITGGTGNWSALVAIDMGTVTGLTAKPAAGNLLTVKITKASTGVQVPALAIFGVPKIS